MSKRPDQAAAATRPYQGTDNLLGGVGRSFQIQYLRDVLDAYYLAVDGDQTLAGVKTFTDQPVVPATGIRFGASDISEADIKRVDQGLNGLLLGASSGVSGVSVVPDRVGKHFSLTFTLADVVIPVTDAGASGSSGSVKLFDFVPGRIVPLGCWQSYTSFTEGLLLTTAAGDAAFVMGVGSVAANAGDGALSGTEVNFGATTSTITLASGVGSGSQINGASTGALDGTLTAVDLYLNWSGSAASIDASDSITVSGTVIVDGKLL